MKGNGGNDRETQKAYLVVYFFRLTTKRLQLKETQETQNIIKRKIDILVIYMYKKGTKYAYNTYKTRICA